MKTIYTLKSWSIVIIIMITLFTPVLAQARYKHLPRVRIEKQIQDEAVVEQNAATPVILEEKIVEQPLTPTPIMEEPATKTDVLTTTLIKHERVDLVKIKVKEEPQKQDRKSFSERTNTKHYLRGIKEVKEVKKTMLIGYLLWFLIVLLLGLAIMTVAFILLGVIAYSLWYIFLVFGVVGLLIALLILIFGLTDIIA